MKNTRAIPTGGGMICGVPKQMSASLLLAPELFPEGPSRKTALDTCAQAVYKKGYTGNNLLFIAENRLKLGLLARDPEIIHEAAEKLKSTLVRPLSSAWAADSVRQLRRRILSQYGVLEQHIPQHGMAVFKQRICTLASSCIQRFSMGTLEWTDGPACHRSSTRTEYGGAQG